MAILIKLLPALAVAAWLYWILTAGKRMSASLRRNSTPLSDWRLIDAAQSYAKALESPPFEIRVFDMAQVNAVALPTGEIYLSSALRDKYIAGEASADEVAAVIGHEIGHVALGHVQRRVETGRAQMAMLALIGFIVGRALFGWWALLAALGLGMINGRSAQRDEFEADAFAAQIMMRTGRDPAAAISMLRKVERWGGTPPDQPIPLRWMLTHPPIAERVAYLEQVIAAGPPADDPRPALA